MTLAICMQVESKDQGGNGEVADEGLVSFRFLKSCHSQDPLAPTGPGDFRDLCCTMTEGQPSSSHHPHLYKLL